MGIINKNIIQKNPHKEKPKETFLKNGREKIIIKKKAESNNKCYYEIPASGLLCTYQHCKDNEQSRNKELQTQLFLVFPWSEWPAQPHLFYLLSKVY